MEKKYIAYFSILLVGLLFIVRLFYIQVLDSKYKGSPLNNSAVTPKYDYPERGFIYDRNGVLIVANQPSYDVMVVPRDVKPLDTIEFCNLLKIDKEEFIKKYNKAKNYSPRLPSVFVAQLSKSDYAYLQEKMFKYKGFYIQKRSLRQYPIKSAANVLGYISEVTTTDLKNNEYYQQGELIGKNGVEKEYEAALRGVKGVKYIQKDRFNNVIGPYKGGAYDTLAIVGKDVNITLDIKLQKYAEDLMINKRGGIVAIEPSSGEILALVSTPTYDPNLLVGRERSKNYSKLDNDIHEKPMYDRALLAQYPPGSPFKVLNALIGLQEEVITTDTHFYCYGGFRYGRGSKAFMACHCGVYGSSIRLDMGIYKSCNAYFANTYKRIIEKYPTSSEGMKKWSEHVKSFGLGDFLHNDLSTGRRGVVPDDKLYNRYYPTFNWGASTTISNAIGQGEILTTPIQLANMTATIANKGFYFTPHIIKKIDNKPIQIDKFIQPKKTTIDAEHFVPVIEGMYNTVEKGTARWSKVKGIEICGKTGTAENPHGQDHSIFIAFAPKDNPKIAIAVFVENGYWGSRWAGPIATLMIEKYLKGEISRPWDEKRMFEGSLRDEYDKQLLAEQLGKELEAETE
ncbi:penicillin-binding protein 2 [Aureibaculum sp. 2210JD6-5]|uniref:penicillin-binding protein 2 n=1 Tax=Aureibaculum sp. 2210JD6-5 TaxID=3103957 RepID=UPI002AACA1D1|nr:penicillin-binding protein 2 [Aureibaculum sp. 2210JD6-5]MDY7395318.1 penicillin-binding protein 2 [Aureibaculum sp. 2210JD6-5]